MSSVHSQPAGGMRARPPRRTSLPRVSSRSASTCPGRGPACDAELLRRRLEIEPVRDAQAEHDALAEHRLAVEGLAGLPPPRRAPGPRGRGVARGLGLVPVAHPGRRSRRVVPLEAERRAAEPQVLLAPPVAEVVAGLLARARVVGDLVVREAARGERRLDREEGLGDGAVVRARQPTAPGELPEGRPGLEGQLVTGEVGEPKARRARRPGRGRPRASGPGRPKMRSADTRGMPDASAAASAARAPSGSWRRPRNVSCSA